MHWRSVLRSQRSADHARERVIYEQTLAEIRVAGCLRTDNERQRIGLRRCGGFESLVKRWNAGRALDLNSSKIVNDGDNPIAVVLSAESAR